MKKLIVAGFLWFASALVCGILAAPVTSAQAEKAVGAWLAKGKSLDRTLGRTVASTRTLTATNGAAFHVVRLDRGFVITSGDTKLEPVIAYSTGTTFDESEANPLWVLVRKDMALRAAAAGVVASGSPSRSLLTATSASSAVAQTVEERKWAELLAEDEPSATTGRARKMTMAMPLSEVSDVRVAPLVKSTWGQGSVGSKDVYNRFTPNNCVCGCVATAGAQLMRFFEWPKTSMEQYTCAHCRVDGVPTTLTTQAGLYDWANMPLKPTSGISDAERDAIGKLTSDVGITCGMSYKSGDSGAAGYMLQRALVVNFGYSNAVAMHNNSGCSDVDTKNALVSNLDAGLPVFISINKETGGGHAVVGDGYGYSDKTLYYHFNMGWQGVEDVWYAPPELGSYNVLSGFVYNIYTNQTPDAVIVSGRVLTSAGVPVVRATVTANAGGAPVATKMTNDKGIYAFVLPAGSYSIVATQSESSNSRSVELSACVTLPLCGEDGFGSYWGQPVPKVGNLCDQDVVLNGLASVAEPQFSPALPGGLFYPSTNVTLACLTEGAVIRYTLDGSDPTESSAVYTGPISVEDTVTIKARAFKSDMNPSPVATMTYVYDDSYGDPKGDRFDNPIALSGMSGSRTDDDISGYSKESDEPSHSLVGGDSHDEYQTVWYRWTAPGTGTMTFTGDSRYYYMTVAVYEGEELSLATRLAVNCKDMNQDGSTSVAVPVYQGKTYRIVIVPRKDAQNGGWFSLSWSGDLEVLPPDAPVTAEPQFSPLLPGGLFYPSTNVTLTCSTEGAVIRYTTDGSVPTESSPAYTGPIFVDDTVTIKARAFKSDMYPSPVATRIYVYDASQGAPKGDYFDDPIVISDTNGTRTVEKFQNYTLETSEPYHTLENYSYSRQYQTVWFKWTAPGSGTMTFRTRCVGNYLYSVAVAIYEGTSYSYPDRKAMSKDYTSSGDYSAAVSLSVEQGKTYRIVGVTLYDVKDDALAALTLSWSGDLVVVPEEPLVTAEPQFSPSLTGGLFYPSTNVTLTCSTEGAVIRYTLDGSDPTESSDVYDGPIFVDDTVTIKARAFKSGMNPSPVVTMTYVYDASQGAKGDYFDNPIGISGTSGSRTDDDISAYSTEPGEPNHSGYAEYQTVWYKWTAPGSGTMTFVAKSKDYYMVVAVYEGASLSQVTRLAVNTQANWRDDTTSVAVSVDQGKTYRIVILPFGREATGGWFSLSWSGNLTEVPYDWLAQHYPSATAASYPDLLKTTGANGRTVWVSYLLGLDPTSAASDLKITSISFENGEPVFGSNANESWIDGLGYKCTIKGKTNLDDADWAEKAPGHRYFRVFVEPK